MPGGAEMLFQFRDTDPALLAKLEMFSLGGSSKDRVALKMICEAEAQGLLRPGSIIIDLAADSGGNCAATVPGETIITDNGVTIIGHRNWPSRIAVAASQLYARNLLTFLTTFWDKEAGAPKLPETDDIIKGVMLTRGGAVVHPSFVPSQAA